MERVRRERWGCRGPEQEASFCRACSVPWAKLVSFGFGEGGKLIMFSVPQSYIFHIFYQVQLALLQATNKCIIKSSIYDTLKSESEVAQSSPTLCDPMDCSLPGSSVHGIFQARVLKWVAISFSRGSSQRGIKPWSPALQADTLLSEPPGKHCLSNKIFKNPLRTIVFYCLMALGLPGGSYGKESTFNAGNSGLIPGSGRSL